MKTAAISPSSSPIFSVINTGKLRIFYLFTSKHFNLYATWGIKWKGIEKCVTMPARTQAVRHGKTGSPYSRLVVGFIIERSVYLMSSPVVLS
jgi:hypothetical protein